MKTKQGKMQPQLLSRVSRPGSQAYEPGAWSVRVLLV
jgi:hypothetical protein